MRAFIIGAALGMCVAMSPGAVAMEPAQQEKSFEKAITMKVKTRYLLYLPPGYESDKKAWPLILFLHGAGESGNDLSRVKKHGPPMLIENKKWDHPCIVVSPQCTFRSWNNDVLTALLDEVVSKYRVDKDRIYLTGISMGGFGTWSLAAAQPERFAAIVPICGGGSASDAPKLKNLPIWVFHGAKDTTVSPKNSESMVEALKKAGGNVKYTLYPDAGHECWIAAYEEPELYRWLLAQKRKP